jgi:hypothetical protein
LSLARKEADCHESKAKNQAVIDQGHDKQEFV